MHPYAELHCVSNFSFLRGASHAEELVARAQELGYASLAITDECSLAGVVRAHLEAKRVGMALLIGAEFNLVHRALNLGALNSGVSNIGTSNIESGSEFRLVLIAQSRLGYGQLSALITRARMRAKKGVYELNDEDFDIADSAVGAIPECIAILITPWIASNLPDALAQRADLLKETKYWKQRFKGRLWLGVNLLMHGNDAAILEQARWLGQHSQLPLCATGNVHFHIRSRKTLHDTLTAIRLNKPINELGFELQPNAEQHLRSRLRLAQLYPQHLMEETLEIASRCRFSLDELRYEYPQEIVPAGHTPSSWLRQLTYDGALLRFPDGIPALVQTQIEHELKLIADLKYEPFFLTVADIVQFARSQGILCQGRGSAANSAVCYCCGITEVDPARMSVLFERFISKERNEPPDIDVDFEHQRREEVIQYIYRKYGRDRAALAATVVTYRPRSAMRDVGKALGIDLQRIEQLSKSQNWWDGKAIRPERFAEAGFDPESNIVKHWMQLAQTLMAFPRHLSQHVGGFVIARDTLANLVPVENASMPERTVIQWDKDDLDALGLLKVDVLALGMLSAIRRALEWVGERRNIRDAQGNVCPLRVQDIPAEDPATYEMISQADTLGVFQIESRAQMSMLPRLQPRCFYDLVIEVAIVRPGPIQGGMVHPYLRRRQGLEIVEYPKDDIKPALARTLGVPIFQEQVMQIAIIAAGFSPGEADQLRRSMAAWKRKGGLHHFYERVINGMLERGYERDFAERIFKQIEGFGEYGFPESHAASFALLVYISCWLKCHEPSAFLAAMLNSQPMGFYAPAQLVRDARDHGVPVLPVDVNASGIEASLVLNMDRASIHSIAPTPNRARQTDDDSGVVPVRLGLNQVSGLSSAAMQRIASARQDSMFVDVTDLAQRADLNARELQALAAADALHSIAGHRRHALWETSALQAMPALLKPARVADDAFIHLDAPTEVEETLADYAALGIPMHQHPLSLLRHTLNKFQVQPYAVLQHFPNGRLARASGLVTHRQRPETAKGVVFVTLEDETGAINVIVWPDLLTRYRKEVLRSRLMTVYGVWQRDEQTSGRVMHLVARRVVDHSHLLGELAQHSRDFR
jgi:error-prone DNA polymerase